MKRWQPKNGEEYWMVNEIANAQEVVWWDDKFDRGFYEIGNCFKTAAEAVAAAEKFKALLLSLHDKPVTNCNQLPKLTAEVFDRPDCPEWAKYAAVAAGGNVIYFSNKPYPDDISGVWHGAEKWGFIEAETGGTLKCNATDWQNSLIERHATLPDWCEVGEWVYNTVYKEYVQISDIDEFEVSLKDGAYCSMGIKSFLEDCRQARLRPYNAEEMKALVGKVITFTDGAVALCTAYSVQNNIVIIDNTSWKPDSLINVGYSINGKPCGVLEHLENGEWKE